MSIYFFHPDGEYGFLSNFSNHGIDMDGKYWPTVEHYYQAQKFTDVTLQEEILHADNPDIAKRRAHKMKEHIRSDWSAVKDEIMTRAILKKFDTHKELQNLLVATENEELIENSKSDFYWGCGWNGTGQNRLGKVLMDERRRLIENQNCQ